MYYGAISTDIRKSSTNWNLFPEWMQKAVNYTNNITEFVFNDTNLLMALSYRIVPKEMHIHSIIDMKTKMI